MKKLIFKAVTLAAVAALALGALFLPMISTQARGQSGNSTLHLQTPIRSAYERGYVNGYNDGYRSGMADYGAMQDRNYECSRLYQDADRGYWAIDGTLADYKEGYRLGFEFGYNDGYYGRPLNSNVPPHALVLKGLTAQTGRTIAIPDGTEMRLRLMTQLNTKANREGDSFTASVIEPARYEGAIVIGHIASLKRSGTMTGRTELALDFDRITLRDGQRGEFSAQIEKIYATESIKSIDEEGNIESASKTKETELRTAGVAVLGAIIGAIAGGGKGAAIGAVIGAGAGAGSVYVQGKKDLILEAGTQMAVRTFTPQRAGAKQR